MKKVQLFIYLIFLLGISIRTVKAAIDPDERRSFRELIQSRGFELQEYTVTTEDDYIITIHRVVPRDYDAAAYCKHRKPVIAFHGILGSSVNFFYNSPHLTNESDSGLGGDNFGFNLVMSGKYDVWAPNARGNGYSDGHVRLNSKRDRKYWDFSFQQIALYDIPAVLSLVRNKTGHQTVGWVGHSQGAGSLFALLSLKPQYAAQIRPFISWAPAVYMGRAKTILGPGLALSYRLIQAIGGKFVLSHSFIYGLLQAICRPVVGLDSIVCKPALDVVFGRSDSINETRIPVYFHHLASYSSWQLTHLTQLGVNKDRFTQFDYLSKSKNKKVYGNEVAPEFPLGNIPKANFPVVVMYGTTDALIDPLDAQQLIKTLRLGGKADVIDYPVPSKTWSHVDFVVGKGGGKLVYDPTMDFLDQYVIQDGPK